MFRTVRASNDGKIDVVALVIPSKLGSFDQSYYPAFPANEASMTAEEWFGGANKPPKTMQMTQQKGAGKKAGGLKGLKAGAAKAAAPEESKGEDTSALQAKVAHLEAALAAAQSSSGATEAAPAEDLTTKPVLGYWKIRGLSA